MLNKKALVAAALIAGFLLFMGGAGAGAAERAIKLVVNGRHVQAEPMPILAGGRVFVPVRVVAEQLGARVNWDSSNWTVIIDQDQGDSYLKGMSEELKPEENIMKASYIKNLLDDDRDNDLADYRQGHSGGDRKDNDPLVVDLRAKSEYDAGHIPGAVWVAEAKAMAEPQNFDKLNALLNQHAAGGGKREIVLYCSTGSMSGLVAGVLGSRGLPARIMEYGFDIAWSGTRSADRAIKANMEDAAGVTIQCGG